MNKSTFKAFMYETNIEGSGKASSYIRALDVLGQILAQQPADFTDCTNIWNICSVKRLEALRHKVIEEQKKGSKSTWNIKSIPKSYLMNGYCSAALRSYQIFLVEHLHEKQLYENFSKYSGDSKYLADKLNREVTIPNFLQEDYQNLQGKEVVRTVTARTNQNVFRKIILDIYQKTCCITGLDIPTVNRASHIVSWSEDVSNRMNPCNGLCLSATYDAAFDQNLISLDEHYRIILSRDITDHFSNQSVTEYFLKKEGCKIQLPRQYAPDKYLLERHRAKGNF